ncbi:MAG: hypothetical protein V3580_04580 [Candidatus Cardinium sp.]|nr:hypothetical protein [Candidatus Cardinium sp.]
MRTKHFTIWVVYILFNMTACSFHQKDYVNSTDTTYACNDEEVKPFDSGCGSDHEHNLYEIGYGSAQGSRSSEGANGKDKISNLHLPSTSTGVSETNATQPAQQTNKKKQSKSKKSLFNFKKNKHSNNSDSGLEESEDEDDGEDDDQGCNEVKKAKSRKEKREEGQKTQKIQKDYMSCSSQDLI